ncbi:MAG: leucine-rich repeat protein [Solobacterium sp.]|nr:leucine-rich repeat protein [Solobacterium sp.]
MFSPCVITETDAEIINSYYETEHPSYMKQYDEIYTLRENMIGRKADGIAHFHWGNDWEIAEEIITLACTHTGIPDGGDYLESHLEQYGISLAFDQEQAKGIIATYSFEYRTDSSQEAKVTEQLRTVLNQLNVYDKNDYQKVKAVYEWIAANVSYSTASDLCYTAYGALISRKAACQGYSSLFYRMMLELGVDCRIISGTGNGGAHAWNIVKLGDLFYNIDVTWASTANNNPGFFLKGSKNFADHTADEKYLEESFTAAFPISESDYKASSSDLSTASYPTVYLEEHRKNVYIGTTDKLTAKVISSTAKAVWTSSDPLTVSVDSNGTITAHKTGHAFITVKAQNGISESVCEVNVRKGKSYDGKAYAIFVPAPDYDTNPIRPGELVLFRSTEDYTELEGWTEDMNVSIKDLNGTVYDGYLFMGEYEKNVYCGAGEATWKAMMYKITSVRVADGCTINPDYLDNWFSDCRQLKAFNGKGFDLNGTKSASDMFRYCEELENVSFPDLDMTSITNYYEMFSVCHSLKTIDLTSFTGDLSRIKYADMFYGCPLESVTFGADANQLIPIISGKWTNGKKVMTMDELRAAYPTQYKTLAGTWTKYTEPSPSPTPTATPTPTPKPTPTPTPTPTAAPVIKIAMYRLYNPNSYEHFYTGNAKEKDALVKMGWKYEGIGWYAPKTSNTPVYRLYNPNNGGDHHYTKNKKEYDALCKAGWKGEDIRWYSDDAKSVPVYREYNPGQPIRNHNYTANKKEHDYLVKTIGWKDEGIGWYGVK